MANPKVYNMRHGQMPLGSIYVGRPTSWGNPFIIGPDGNRAEVIEKFRVYISTRPDFQTAIKAELQGKDLICWCAPLPCHADVLLEIANG